MGISSSDREFRGFDVHYRVENVPYGTYSQPVRFVTHFYTFCRSNLISALCLSGNMASVEATGERKYDLSSFEMKLVKFRPFGLRNSGSLCNAKTRMEILCFWTSSIVLFLFQAQHFEDCALPPSSGKTYSAGPNRYRPHLRTPEPTKDVKTKHKTLKTPRI